MTLNNLTPDTANCGSHISEGGVYGDYFILGTTPICYLSKSGRDNVYMTGVIVVSKTLITFSWDVPYNESELVEYWDFNVVDYGSMPNAMICTTPSMTPPLAPVVLRIDPATAPNDTPFVINRLCGGWIKAGASVKLTKVGEPDIIASNITVHSWVKISCIFNTVGVSVGLWDIVITNPGGYTGVLTGGLEITLSLKPVANFSAEPIIGDTPLEVQFVDLSTNTPTYWIWDFDDGWAVGVKNPTHVYKKSGAYSPTLTVTNAAGSDTKTKWSFILVAWTVERYKPMETIQIGPDPGTEPIVLPLPPCWIDGDPPP